jgi:hypothetical protein
MEVWRSWLWFLAGVGHWVTTAGGQRERGGWVTSKPTRNTYDLILALSSRGTIRPMEDAEPMRPNPLPLMDGHIFYLPSCSCPRLQECLIHWHTGMPLRERGVSHWNSSRIVGGFVCVVDWFTCNLIVFRSFIYFVSILLFSFLPVSFHNIFCIIWTLFNFFSIFLLATCNF